MSRVLHRRQAAADIADIWQHIAQDKPEAADHWIDDLDQQFGLLARQPLIGRERQELAMAYAGFRSGATSFFSLRLPMASTFCAYCTRPWTSKPGLIRARKPHERGQPWPRSAGPARALLLSGAMRLRSTP